MQKLLYLFSLLILPLSASFAQQVVSTNADDGAGSLRAAITAGNSTSAPYSITFTTAGPISLTAVLPEITQSCTIIGQSLLVPATASGGTTIERSTAGGIPNFRIFKAVTDGKVLVLQDLVLQNGVANEEILFRQGGGALYAKLGSGELTMARCLIRNCATIGNKSGGGVQLESGSGIIADCQFSNNTVGADAAGGGFINGTDLSGNPNLVTFQRCTFVNNRAARGGAFFHRALATATTLVNCSFSANSSTFRGNAIYNYSGNLNLVHCSFIGNSGAERTMYGSLTSSSHVQVVNCLFSGNTNSGLGMGNFYNSGGLMISLGGNVSNDADETYLNQSSDKNSQTLLVGPLQQNPGGLVSTHSIGDCSPAKDAGVTSATVTLPTTDANNQPRISPPDAGAFEEQTPSSTVAGPITASGPASCASPARLTAPATGSSFVFTGPNGYVFSNVYRNGGGYTAFAEGVKLGGTYTLTVSSGPGCPTTTSTIVVQGPSSCP